MPCWTPLVLQSKSFMSDAMPNSSVTSIRVLLADDHRFFRDGVRSLLSSVDGFEVVVFSAPEAHLQQFLE